MTTSNVETRTHGTCATGGCDRSKRNAIGFQWRWHLLEAYVYSSDRSQFVIHSWAEACNEHKATVAAAVRADVEQWAERWRVECSSYDYATNTPQPVEVLAQGTGTPPEMLF